MRPRVAPTGWLGVTVLLAMMLGACAAPPAASPSVVAVGDAVSGVCQARAALPDVEAANRAFTNLAHQALHTLAAEPRLPRDLAARVLEAMEAVEADFQGGTNAATLDQDLGELQAAAAQALEATGREVPGCDG